MARARFFRSCLALVLAAALTGCGGGVELVNSLSEREANEVVAALSQGGITAKKLPGKEGAVNLAVDQADVAKAILLMQAEGLPRERRATMGDVFKKEGLISSPLEERARYLWALSQELSETISQIDGVIKARVHVVLPERSTGGEPALPSTASVFVKHRRGYSLEDSLPQIRRLVAGSIPGLSPDKVNVVLVEASPPEGFPPAMKPATSMANAGSAASSASAAGTPMPLGYALAALLGMAALGVAGFWLWWSRRGDARKPADQLIA
jgi:type III secretion protein J